MFEIEVRVTPNARKFKVESKGGRLAVSVRSKADGGRANAELVEKLSEMLCCAVQIAHGHKERKKRLRIFCSKEEFGMKINNQK